MATPVDFPGANLLLGPPKGMTEEEVQTMPVCHINGQYVSCWRLSDEELSEILVTREIWQTLLGSGAQPSFVGSRSTVIDLVLRDSNKENEN